MKTIPPTTRKRVLEAWQLGNRNEHQLAVEFNLSRDIVAHIISESGSAGVFPANRRVLSIARELYNVAPVEVVRTFAQHVEEVTGVRSGLLMVPNI